MNVERMPKEGEMPIVVKGSRFWEIGEGGAVGWMTFEHDSQCGAPKPPCPCSSCSSSACSFSLSSCSPWTFSSSGNSLSSWTI